MVLSPSDDWGSYLNKLVDQALDATLQNRSDPIHLIHSLVMCVCVEAAMCLVKAAMCLVAAVILHFWSAVNEGGVQGDIDLEEYDHVTTLY